MARYPLRGKVRDGNGKIVPSAIIQVFLADTATAVNSYATKTGGANILGVATTDSNGDWVMYVNDSEYPKKTLFDATVSKDPGYVTQTYEDIAMGG
jgi:protocatechuate 3,4-dioxygenase beta subunit